jgi:DNA-binding NarL/FixJ family response regulator
MAMLAKAPADRPTALEVQAGLKGFLGPEKFERARERIGVEGRAARMISTIRPAGTEAPVVDAADAMVVAVIGELEGDLVVALAVNGIVAYIVSDEQPIEGAHAIFAPQLSPEALGALKREHGLPVVTDTLPSDVARLPALLRAGVDEVLPRPVRAEELARRVARAVKKSRAAQRKGT